MMAIWKNLSEAGIDGTMDFQLSKKVRLTNQIAISLSFIAFCYAFVFYFVGFKKEGLYVLVIVSSVLLSVFFNRKMLYFLARIWLVTSVNIAVIIYACIFGKDAGLQLVFLPAACIPWILFELRDWKYITIGVMLPIFCYYFFSSGSGLPLVAITPDVQHFIYQSIVIAVFLILALCMLFFASQNYKSEQNLLDIYRRFFEDIPTPMWIFDEKTLKFLAVNEMAAKKYGYTKEEFATMTLKDIRVPEEAGLVEEFIRKRSNDKFYDAGYIRHRKKNGDIFYAHILSNTTRFKDKKARVALAIDVNEKVVTGQKNEELTRTLQKANEVLQANKEEMESQQEELRQINDELLQQTEELKASEEELRMQEEELRQVNTEMEEKTEIIVSAQKELTRKAEELEISSRYKSEFLANMSHELRTPLNSVLILAKLLEENKLHNLTEKQMQYAKIIHKSGSDLLNLINDILDLSKIEAGKIDIFIEEVSVVSITDDMEQLFTALAADKKIAFSIITDEDVPEKISTDKQRIEQVIKNLLSNAFKFTPEGGKVTLRFYLDAGQMAIAVSDTGIGIPQEKQQLIFEAFQQADGSTSRRFGGTGLGLSISKELLKKLGGEIKISSKPGHGSVFTLLFPMNASVLSSAVKLTDLLQTVDYKPENIKEQNLIADDKKEIKPGQQSILIIDDDAVFAGHVQDFAHEKGYKTIVAISGDEGLFYAKKYKPSAIILDLGLPVIDGKNVLRLLKTEKELMDIPVHVVTATDRSEVPVGDVESYFQKPLMDDDLERAFADIGSYISERYKNILILLPEHAAMRNIFEKLVSEKNDGVVYDVVKTTGEAADILRHKKIDCIIADIGGNISAGASALKDFKDIAGQGVYIITCIDRDISTHDEKQLKNYSDSIIRKSNHSSARLLDEVSLFLHKIKSSSVVTVPAGYDGNQLDRTLEGRKVLIADDDMRNIFSITALLEEHGMEVIAAEHGKEALNLLEQHNDVDIILMDIMMPEMDGYETIKHIRAGGRYKKIPIIALTAKAMIGDKEMCLEAGASDYITKPVDGKKLFSLMSVWLSN
jgi:PAS domain S-box-containing protein